jgi:hypothetical protein
MELWHGDLPDFVNGAQAKRLAGEMEARFRQIHRRPPGESEYQSWERSLAAFAQVVDTGARTDDVGVLVEYHLPLSERRIDVMLFGKDAAGAPNSVLVELKQWDNADFEDEYALNLMVGNAEHLHPSQQALDYAEYLRDVHLEYVAGTLGVLPCSYLHDMPVGRAQAVSDPRFAELLADSPVFLKGQEADLAELIGRSVAKGDGYPLMQAVRAGTFKPGKKVLDCIEEVIRLDDEWHLLDEQRKAFNAIWAELLRIRASRERRAAVLVRGGPGTGKSVIAIQVLANALRERLAAAHSTGGKAFTTVLQSKFRGASAAFRWNMSLRNASPLELDLLLVDEAHRIRQTSDIRFTPKAERNRKGQFDELLDASRVTVFFLDEHQYMRPDEIGSTELVRAKTAARNIPLKEYDLVTQFRCGGSRDYVDWVDELLGFPASGRAAWHGQYVFDVVDEAADLDMFVESARQGGDLTRLVAGFCWKWSEPNKDGSLVDDVVIGDWARPWNRKPGEKVHRPEQHPYTLWATTPEGEEQVGCIYSAQGFEFDRVGVIWGPDLVWRSGAWVGVKKASKDPGLNGASPEQVTRLLRHAYRVLLTRGIRGTKVLCLDAETRQHMADCIAAARARALAAA